MHRREATVIIRGLLNGVLDGLEYEGKTELMSRNRVVEFETLETLESVDLSTMPTTDLSNMSSVPSSYWTDGVGDCLLEEDDSLEALLREGAVEETTDKESRDISGALINSILEESWERLIDNLNLSSTAPTPPHSLSADAVTSPTDPAATPTTAAVGQLPPSPTTMAGPTKPQRKPRARNPVMASCRIRPKRKRSEEDDVIREEDDLIREEDDHTTCCTPTTRPTKLQKLYD